MERKRIKILGSCVDRIDQKEALENIRLFLSEEKGRHVVTLNSEMIVRARSDRDFAGIINGADLVVADGMGVVRAASYLGRKTGNPLVDARHLLAVAIGGTLFPRKIKDVIPEKVSGIDLMRLICESDFARGKKIYLLGAGEGIAEKTGAVLGGRYPAIEIVGAEAGFRGELGSEEKGVVLERINAKRPDMIFVALGAPKQEKWISENLEKMPSVRLAMGVGGSFDVISGKTRRAPQLFQAHGMEWLWRFALEPRRAGRIYNAALKFSWLIFRDKE